MTWLKTDPRHHFNKRGRIIIAKPNIKGRGQVDLGIGEVETHQAYNILTTFENHKWISEGDKWDQDWKWIEWPKDEEDIKPVIFD